MIEKCANCGKEINLKKEAQTYCPGCEKDFCFASISTCFSDYHKKNELKAGHFAHSISDPTYVVSLRTGKAKDL